VISDGLCRQNRTNADAWLAGNRGQAQDFREVGQRPPVGDQGVERVRGVRAEECEGGLEVLRLIIMDPTQSQASTDDLLRHDGNRAVGYTEPTRMRVPPARTSGTTASIAPGEPVISNAASTP
jgi:hypothetical protein